MSLKSLYNLRSKIVIKVSYRSVSQSSGIDLALGFQLCHGPIGPNGMITVKGSPSLLSFPILSYLI